MKKYDQHVDIQNVKQAQVFDMDELIFYQFKCPHCGGVNVQNKASFASDYSVCAYGGCRKVIRLDRKQMQKAA